MHHSIYREVFQLLYTVYSPIRSDYDISDQDQLECDWYVGETDVTLGTFVWNTGKDANYSARLDAIEKELDDLDSRLDTAELFRMEIGSDLAMIKTDLL